LLAAIKAAVKKPEARNSLDLLQMTGGKYFENSFYRVADPYQHFIDTTVLVFTIDG